MKKSNLKYYYLGGGIVLAIALYLILKDRKKSPKNIKGIIIGDSQSPYIAKQSQKAKLLGQTGNESNLWKVGQNLNWLVSALKNYPTSKDITHVVISIGTNGGFNIKDNITGLISELKRAFPNANLLAVKGSWGWGGNKNKTEKDIDAYYSKFSNLGVEVIKTPIGAIEPHGDKPVYKIIGKEIDNLIK